ncbi:hypothetical protein D3C72_527800 [compost metagenome]
MALAPLQFACAGAEMPTQHIAFGLQAGQGLFDGRQRFAKCCRNLRTGQRAMAAQAGSQQFDQRNVRLDGLIEAWQYLQRRFQPGAGIQYLQQAQPLTRQPQFFIHQAQGPAGFGQLPEQQLPAGIALHFVLADGTQAHQRFMHFVGIARLRPGLGCDGGDGIGVQRAQVVAALHFAPAPVEHRLSAPFFQWRVIQEGIGPCIEDGRRQRRRGGQISAQQAHRAAFHTPQKRQPAFAVHRLVQAVVEGLLDQRMIGNLPLADDVLQAGDLIGEYGGNQVFALHPLDLWRHLATADKARQGHGHAGVPAPAHAKQRRIEQRLDKDRLGAAAIQVTPHIVQFETVAGGQRQHDGVLAGCRLQLEVEGTAEALAQGQAPGAVDAAAVGRMDDQLGTAGLIEEALHHQRVLRGQGAEHFAGAGQVVEQLAGGGFAQFEGTLQPCQHLGLVVVSQLLVDLRLQPGHRGRQLVAAPRRLAQPERDGRWQAMGILHPHPARLDPQDSIGGIAKLEDVAGDAFHGEVFVDAADVQRLRFEQHGVVGVVGDGAAAGQGGQLAAAAATQGAAHRIAVQVGTAHALAAVVALGEHAQQGLVMLLVELGVGRGLAQAVEQGLFVPGLVAGFGDDLLGQHVQRRPGNVQFIQLAPAYAVEQGHAFDQVIARGREQAPLGHAIDLVSGAADPLQQGRDRAWRSDLADQVDVADIDAQLQRCSGHQHLQLAILQALFGIQA